jgi:hypothetical protein
VKSAAAHVALTYALVAWGGTASAPSAEPQRRTKALNQSTSTPQDEAELIPPECVGGFLMRLTLARLLTLCAA